MKTVLDLFSGTGGFSQAFVDDDDWKVITVDIDEEFEPDMVADVMDLYYDDFPEVDLVLASPPCNAFSIANCYNHWEDGEPESDLCKHSIQLVHHTMGLIKALNPDYWFMENPRGMLRKVIGEPPGVVTWCQYGADNMKPTDLWGHHPDTFRYKSCSYGDSCHISCPNDDTPASGVQAEGYACDRAKIPYELSMAIKGTVENVGQQSEALDW